MDEMMGVAVGFSDVEWRFYDAIVGGCGEGARGPALLAGPLADLHRFACRLAQGSMGRALDRLFGGSLAGVLGALDGDAEQLTLAFAFGCVMRVRGPVAVRREHQELVMAGGGLGLVVRIGARGRLQVSGSASSWPTTTARAFAQHWRDGEDHWPRIGSGARRLAARADACARVPSELRRMLGGSVPRRESPIAAGAFVRALVECLAHQDLVPAAMGCRGATGPVLTACSKEQLTVLVACDVTLLAREYVPWLPCEIAGRVVLVCPDGTVPNSAWQLTSTPRAADPSQHRPINSSPVGEAPNTGVDRSRLGTTAAVLSRLLPGVVAGAAAVALFVFSSAAAAGCVLGTWLTIELARGRVWALSDRCVSRVLATVSGVVAAVAYAVIYLPALLIPLLAARLGVAPRALGGLPVLASLGFGIGLAGQVMIRRRLKCVSAVRSGLLAGATVGLLAIALAPTGLWIDTATLFAGVAASVGVLLKTEAVAAKQALAGTAAGHAMAGMTAAFLSVLSLLLLAPSLLPSVGPESVTSGLSSASWLLIVLAAVMFASWRMLPAILDRKPDMWTATPGDLFRDRTLWRAITLTSLSVAALTPAEQRIVFILTAHGVAHPVVWASRAMLAILPAAALMPPWGRLVHRNPRLAERISIGATLAAALIGVVSVKLPGHAWATAFLLAYLSLEVSTSLAWACAETEAVKDPTDVGRIALLNAIRYSARVPIGAFAVLAAHSETISIWTPAACLAGLALIIQIAWKTTHKPPASPLN